MVQPAQIVAIGNLKGGTGKSTLTLNLGCALAGETGRVGILDADPQGTVARWAAHKELPVVVWHHPVAEVAEVGGWLQALAARQREVDVLLIDLPAVVSPALAAAFMRARLILIPTSTSPIEIEATRRTLRHVAVARRERRADPPSVLVIPNRIERHLLGRENLRAIAGLSEEVGPIVDLDPLHRRAFGAGEWIGQHAKRSSAHKRIAALAQRVALRLHVNPESTDEGEASDAASQPREEALVAA